jgi:hypothetical protein
VGTACFCERGRKVFTKDGSLRSGQIFKINLNFQNASLAPTITILDCHMFVVIVLFKAKHFHESSRKCILSFFIFLSTVEKGRRQNDEIRYIVDVWFCQQSPRQQDSDSSGCPSSYTIMSSNLNELQNATVGMTCGVIEVRALLASICFILLTMLVMAFFGCENVYIDVRIKHFSSSSSPLLSSMPHVVVMLFKTGADFAALQLLQKHGATAAKDFAQSHGHVSRRRS